MDVARTTIPPRWRHQSGPLFPLGGAAVGVALHWPYRAQSGTVDARAVAGPPPDPGAVENTMTSDPTETVAPGDGAASVPAANQATIPETAAGEATSAAPTLESVSAER